MGFQSTSVSKDVKDLLLFFSILQYRLRYNRIEQKFTYERREQAAASPALPAVPPSAPLAAGANANDNASLRPRCHDACSQVVLPPKYGGKKRSRVFHTSCGFCDTLF